MTSNAMLCKNVSKSFCEIKIIISKVNDEGIPTKFTKSKFYLTTHMEFFNYLSKNNAKHFNFFYQA